MDELLTLKEAAVVARCSYWTIREWCHLRGLRHVRVGRGPIRIYRSTLEKFLKRMES
ncbi:MAG: helix-turn-helix domain-containing protein [Hyphomicrobiaceae bacterium]|nr:MAG: helix-turn-helix domain-containing protein [Hyphomicrobiaceae bacterium]